MPRIGTHFLSGKTLQLLRSIEMRPSSAPFRPFSPDGTKVIYSLPNGKQLLEQHYPTAEAAQSAIWTVNHLIEHLAELSVEDAESALQISSLPLTNTLRKG